MVNYRNDNIGVGAEQNGDYIINFVGNNITEIIALRDEKDLRLATPLSVKLVIDEKFDVMNTAKVLSEVSFPTKLFLMLNENSSDVRYCIKIKNLVQRIRSSHLKEYLVVPHEYVNRDIRDKSSWNGCFNFIEVIKSIKDCKEVADNIKFGHFFYFGVNLTDFNNPQDIKGILRKSSLVIFRGDGEIKNLSTWKKVIKNLLKYPPGMIRFSNKSDSESWPIYFEDNTAELLGVTNNTNIIKDSQLVLNAVKETYGDGTSWKCESIRENFKNTFSRKK